MIAIRRLISVMAWLTMVGMTSAHGEANVPLGGGPTGIEGLKLIHVGDVKARLEQIGDADKAVAKATFTKESEIRRFLALEAKPLKVAPGVRALVLRYRVSLARGQRPRLAAVLFERGGGVWFNVVAHPAAIGKFAEGRIPLGAVRQTSFSDDASGKLEWEEVEKAWAGIVLDGPSKGSFELSQALFTSEPYKPTRPLRITGDGPGKWSVGKDPAVRAKLTTPNEGPDGKHCMKFEFTFPGQRHMYAVPQTPVPDAELEGYRALRFTYRASLPPGIKGLLIMLIERGGAQYLVEPAPHPSEKWTTIAIPFERFVLGGWSKDADGKLDLEEVATVAIACHGAASGAGGDGTILAADIEFAP